MSASSRKGLNVLWLCCFCTLTSFRIPDLIQTPISRPFSEPPPKEVFEQTIDKLENITPRTAEEEYMLSLYYILAEDFEKSQKHLTKALQLNPNFTEAQVQMGFLLLWQNQKEDAQYLFRAVLYRKPCEKIAMYGLEQIAKKSSDREAISIYQELLPCQMQNVDILFSLGQLYLRNNQREEAKTCFLEVLHITPRYDDASIQLARIYFLENNYESLKILAEKHPHQQEIQHIYARFLVRDQNYQQAKKIYKQLAPNESIWKDQFALRSNTDISATLEATYTDAMENDPSIRKSVVKDYYFLSAVNAFFPVYDTWRLDARAFLYHQRENDIYPPVGVNYNAYLSGAQLVSHYHFAPHWKWDLTLRCFDGWGAGEMFYPFQSTTRFETGTSLRLNSEHLFVLDAHIESFIIKNFEDIRSQLMQTDTIQTAYGYRPDIQIHPQVEGWAGWIYYHDSLHNVKNKQSIRAQMDLYTPLLTTFYLFEHSGFRHLNENYFSYKKQIRQTMQLRYHQEFFSKFLFEIFWDHTWEVTKQLFLPIGDFIFVANRLYLIWNKITAQMSYRYQDTFKIEIGGHYLHTTLPYRDWNLRGEFLWQF